MSGALLPGFTDAVGDAQACFRLVLDAMAHPGRVHAVRPVPAPAPLGDAAAAVVLTLVDQETPLWLDADAAAARAWIAFHTGAPVVEAPGRATFAVAVSFPEAAFAGAFSAAAPHSLVMPAAGLPSTSCVGETRKGVDGGPSPTMTIGAAPSAQPVTLPRPSTFPLGTDEAPEASATLVLQVASLTAGRRYRLEGPGLRRPAILAADGLPPDFAAIWQRNHARFPCGIDLILCAGNQLAALPRSVSVQEA
ncbi:phosphonate C-P lyase system protein PhnH [Rhodopila globiformis]|uniref:Phosphonate C-P lyase system protein PhnH n=1 Tax=Rhodopila globiformis TaxID=1071 RepID=A0A2S6NAZ0_RHOGL|nr:phosphonate C-P lyase system protein PhnH [Rhodopila globiformis]PPQ31767.1 phosphonate C-P lyase system protein PhnH [Rhodopila globiformis]